MPLKRTSHAVYDTKYHLVWAPIYRRWIVRDAAVVQRCIRYHRHDEHEAKQLKLF